MGPLLTSARRAVISHIPTILSTFLWLLYAILSVSLPTFNNMDISRIDYNASSAANGTGGIDQIRFGIWSFCLYRKSLDGDPCHSFTPCNFTGDFRVCSPYSYGYDVRIRPDENGQVSGLHVNANWTKALACNAAAAVFTVLNTIMIAIRRPSNIAAILASVCAISAAFINFAFDLFVGNKSGLGMALSIVLAVVSCVQWCATLVERDRRRKHLQDSSWSSWGLHPGNMIGPVKVVKLDVGEKERHHPDSKLLGVYEFYTSECGICWEARDELLALPCTHTFCPQCAKPWVKSLGRCPSCPNMTDRKPNELLKVYCV